MGTLRANADERSRVVVESITRTKWPLGVASLWNEVVVRVKWVNKESVDNNKKLRECLWKKACQRVDKTDCEQSNRRKKESNNRKQTQKDDSKKSQSDLQDPSVTDNHSCRITLPQKRHRKAKRSVDEMTEQEQDAPTGNERWRHRDREKEESVPLTIRQCDIQCPPRTKSVRRTMTKTSTTKRIREKIGRELVTLSTDSHVWAHNLSC